MNNALVVCLDAPFIDPDRIYAVLLRHYVSVFPFLHRQSFAQSHAARKSPIGPQRTVAQANDCNMMLVAALALACQSDAAICHEAGVHMGHRRKNTGASAQSSLHVTQLPPHSYARIVLGALGLDNYGDAAHWTPTSMEQVQAFVMIGMYEWLCEEGPETYPSRLTRWLSAGRGLSRTLDLFRAVPSEPSHCAQSRLRTVLSVTILDRLLTTPAPETSSVEIGQLPLSKCIPESEYESSRERISLGGYGVETALVWFLRILDLFSEVNWFCSQPPRIRNNCPTTNQETCPRFLVLAAHVEKLHSSLPPYWATGTPDARTKAIVRDAMLLVNLCRLMLFRDHIPFIPLETLVTETQHQGDLQDHNRHDMYTVSAAREAYRSAQNIIRHVHAAYLERTGIQGVSATVPLSPVIVNATWHAAVAALHAHHFPHLDHTHALISPDYQIVLNYGFAFNPRNQGTCGQAFGLLGQLARYWRPAKRYRRIFRWTSAFLHSWRQSAIKAVLDPATTASAGAAGQQPVATSDPYLARMRAPGFNSGFSEWEVFRHRYMAIGLEPGRSGWDDDDKYPVFRLVDNAEEFPDYPDYEKYHLDMDLINAWVLMSTTVPPVSASVSVVRRCWNEVAHLNPPPTEMPTIYQGIDITHARSSSTVDAACPPHKWHPLLTNYPAVRMWRWSERRPADHDSALLQNMWRRAIKVDASIAMGNYHFMGPSELQSNTANSVPVVAWLPSTCSKPEIGVAGNLRSPGDCRRVSTDIAEPPFAGWTADVPENVTPELCTFVAPEVLSGIVFRPTEFFPRSLAMAIIDNGASGDEPTWNTRYILNTPPRPLAVPRVIPLTTPPPPPPPPPPPRRAATVQPQQQHRPWHSYSNSFTMQDIASAPTPGNTIPMPVNTDGYFPEGYHINGYYINGSSAPRSSSVARSRQSGGRRA
ncbi:hypothetical protein BROUX41_002358 [Berkeleyomyces rouxiae]